MKFHPENRRGDQNHYARSNRDNLVLGAKEDTGIIEFIRSIPDTKALTEAMNSDHTRMYKVNLLSLHPNGGLHDTIEFRQHEGTTDHKRVVEWIEFLLNLLHRALSMSDDLRSFKNLSLIEFLA